MAKAPEPVFVRVGFVGQGLKENSFFSEVVDILGRTQDYSRFCLYFDQIQNTKGYFPMLMEEKTLLRDAKMKVSVKSINRKKVDYNLFLVPKDFKYLRY